MADLSQTLETDEDGYGSSAQVEGNPMSPKESEED